MNLTSAQKRLLLAGGVICGLVGALNYELMLRAYLFAYFVWLGVAVGCLGLWMVHHLTGGAWGFVLRRIWEAASWTLPVLALLFVPIAVGVTVIFPWTATDVGSKAAYLNVPFFLGRAAVYFAIWIGLAWMLRRSAIAHERTGDDAYARRAEEWSGPGLVLYGLTVTFAAIDWVMSLTPEWWSTIFGALIAVGHLLSALAFAIAVATWLHKTVDRERWNDLGNLLLTFVMLWTYLAFSQYLLIWSGNLPEEITWYLQRIEGGWQWIGLSLAIGYFALPFVLLLAPEMKREPRRLRGVALLVAGMSVINNYWLIAPAFSPSVFRFNWRDPLAFVGMGAIWLFVFLRQLDARPIAIPEESEAIHGTAERAL